MYKLVICVLVSFLLVSCGADSVNEDIVAFAEEDTSISFIFETLPGIESATLQAGSGYELIITFELDSQALQIFNNEDPDVVVETLYGMLDSSEGLLILAANAVRENIDASSVDVIGRFEMNGEIKASLRVTSE